jgi:hypothetical protein
MKSNATDHTMVGLANRGAAAPPFGFRLMKNINGGDAGLAEKKSKSDEGIILYRFGARQRRR